MDDLISRQKAIEVASRECHELRGVFSDIEQGLKELPSVQKTGKWMTQDNNKSNGIMTTCVYYYPKCSECGGVGNFDMNFCPNCGADMRGGTE